jgi:hypothetical protein
LVTGIIAITAVDSLRALRARGYIAEHSISAGWGRVMSEFSQIRYESADRVATITLHRPDRLNAFTTTMARELVAAFDAADADDDVRVVLMTGAGRAFCAGADLGRGASTFDATDPVRAAERAGFETIGGVPRDGGGTVSLRIAASRKPVIVAVNGPAVGVGATMTLPAVGAVRIRVRTPRPSPGGRVELVPAQGCRHIAGDGVGSHGPGVRRGRSARRPARLPRTARQRAAARRTGARR